MKVKVIIPNRSENHVYVHEVIICDWFRIWHQDDYHCIVMYNGKVGEEKCKNEVACFNMNNIIGYEVTHKPKPDIDYKELLSNLLAIIHRDGGHYQSEHGIKKAVEDAKEIIVNYHHPQEPEK